MPPWILVSPASRGLGFTLAQTLLRTTNLSLVATARRDLDATREALLRGSSPAIDDSRLHVLPLDVTEESTIAAAAASCRDLFPPPSWLHAAFILPGILHPEKSPAQLDAANILDTFKVNTIGPLLMLKHFAALLPRKSTPVNLSPEEAGRRNNSSNGDDDDRQASVLPRTHATVLLASARVGSIADNTGLGGWYSYRASKAGVNQVVRTFDNHLRQASGAKALALAYHPGTVKTGLSKGFWAGVPEGKLFSAAFAVDKMLAVVGGAEGRVGDVRGRCWDWKGDEVPP